jgi:hypothetical protein
MSAKSILIGIWVVVSGICGLVQTLLYHEMIEAINTHRPASDQIPAVTSSWSDVRKSFHYGFWFVRKEFRRLFPSHRAYFWHTVTIAIMAAWTLLGLIVLILGVL